MKSLLFPVLAIAVLVAAPPEVFGQGRNQDNGKEKARKAHPVQIIRHQDDGRVIILRDSDDRDDEGRFRTLRRGDDRVFRDRDGRVIVIRDHDDDDGILDDLFDIFDDDDFDDRDFRRRDFRNGRGPAFCRSGEGHPVFGRRWCLEKGFGLGDRNRRFLDRGGIVLGDRDGAIVIDRDGDIIFRPRRLDD